MPVKTTSKKINPRPQLWFRPTGPAAIALSLLMKSWGDDQTATINASLILTEAITVGPVADAIRQRMAQSGKSLPDVLTEVINALTV